MTSSISGATRAAGEVGTAAGQVAGLADELGAQTETLRANVDHFLASIRAARLRRALVHGSRRRN